MRYSTIYKYCICSIVFHFICASASTGQDFDSYGFEIGGNTSWLRLVTDSEINERDKNIGFNFGGFIVWHTPVHGYFKTQLEFVNKRFIHNTQLSNIYDSTKVQFTDRSLQFHTEANYVSLLLGPMFNLSILGLNNYYLLGGAKFAYRLSAKKDAHQATVDGNTVIIEDYTTKRLDRWAWGGALGFGRDLVYFSKRKISIEIRYDFEISDSFSSNPGIEARNRSFEIWIGVHL